MNLSIIHSRLEADNNLPSNWKWYAWKCMPGDSTETLYMEIKGCVADVLFKSGGKKGRPNYRECSDHRKFYVTPEQAKIYEDEWQTMTGGCINCTGSGKTLQRWTRENGCEYKVCCMCNGNGKKENP